MGELKNILKAKETETGRLARVERELRAQIAQLEVQLQESIENSAMLQEITSKAINWQTAGATVAAAAAHEENSEPDESLSLCSESGSVSLSNVRLLSAKLAALNDCFDQLLQQNEHLKKELEEKKSRRAAKEIEVRQLSE